MRNELTLSALERELQANCGDELAAAKAVGVSLLFVNRWCKDDAIVRERLAEASRVGVQGLVSAAIQRGVHGIEEDVYFKGVVVGKKRVYSDGLHLALLKAKVPEFQKDADGAGSVHVNVNVANLMPRATSYEQWLEMKELTTAKALPPPSDEAIAATYLMAEPTEAEFVPVERAFEGIDL